MKYNYDDSGNIFVYFLLIIHGFILSIFTLYYVSFILNERKQRILKEEDDIGCNCTLCQSKRQKIVKAQRSLWKRKGVLYLVFGWISFVVLAYFAWQARAFFTEGYDPYVILELPPGATESEVKKQYRLLSLKFHPDRVEESLKEAAEARFIEISKAYKVLTNEDIRKNYEETGNPDGVHNFTLGIALPSWLIETSNMFWVLALYGAVFGILLPLLVGRWWYRSKNYTKNNIHYYSMALYYQELKDNMSVRKIIEVLTGSFEFKETILWKSQDTSLIPKLMQEVKTEMEARSGEKYEKSKKFSAPFCTKTWCLLMAHLYRIPVASSLLEDQKMVVNQSVHLLTGMIQILIARDWLSTLYIVITLSEMIIQAIGDSSQLLLQLPYVQESVLKNCKLSKKLPKSMQEFLALSEEDQKEIVGSDRLEELEAARLVARKIPRVGLVKPLIQVLGQDNITPGSIVTAVFYFTLYRTQDEEAKLRQIPVDGDEHAFIMNMKSNEMTSKTDFSKSIPVHAPLYSQEKKAYWWAFFIYSKNKSIATTPIKVPFISAASDYLTADLSSDRKLPPTCMFQFAAPSQPGSYFFSLDLKSDSYLGCDFHSDFKVNIVAEKPSLKEKSGNANTHDTEDSDDIDSEED